MFKDKVADQINSLENHGMIDLMLHHKRRWYKLNPLFVSVYSPLYVWQKWVNS